MFEVNLGTEIIRQARFVALWWEARTIPEKHDADLESVVADAPSGPGVYAVTGHHDAQSGQRVLYVGQASQLSVRIARSIRESLSELHANNQRLLYSDVWD
jgi:hypothetical protein